MPRPHLFRNKQVGVKRQDTGAGIQTLRFSVIICTYNRHTLVLATIASLRRQTLSYEQFEVLVVDNGSTDGTLNAVEAYVHAGPILGRSQWRVHCLLEPQNGLAYARNTALKVAAGAIAVFIDDDTFVEPHFLERLLVAYEACGGDAIGGSVEICWEAPRPYWLNNNLLELLGYFAPFTNRTPLPAAMSLSNTNFSVKVKALRHVGGFYPFLSKQLGAPINLEIAELCQRLRQAGYTLWYEPGVVLAHRVPQARLERAFLVGRVYWQGRSEILNQYADHKQYQELMQRSLRHSVHTVLPTLGEIASIVLLRRPLLALARKSTYEQLQATLTQAQLWGRVQQQLKLMNHVPVMREQPAVLLVHADQQDGTFRVKGQLAQGMHYSTHRPTLPLSWLWRHRVHHGQVIGIVHLYQPGAFKLSHWQRQRFFLQLWLAQCLGIRIVVTDASGWGQHVHGLPDIYQLLLSEPGQAGS